MLSVQLKEFAQMHTLVTAAVFKIQNTSFTPKSLRPLCCRPPPGTPASQQTLVSFLTPEFACVYEWNRRAGTHFGLFPFTGQNALVIICGPVFCLLLCVMS